MFGNDPQQIARAVEQTVFNLRELETRIQVLKNDLGVLAQTIGHPEAAKLAFSPIGQQVTGDVGSFSGAGVGQLQPYMGQQGSFAPTQQPGSGQGSPLGQNPYAQQGPFQQQVPSQQQAPHQQQVPSQQQAPHQQQGPHQQSIGQGMQGPTGQTPWQGQPSLGQVPFQTGQQTPYYR